MMYQAEQPIFDEQPVPNRKKYTWILFDLDGTLTDPGQGIRNSVAYALDKMGLPRQTGQELNRFIGPPLQEGFRCLCGLDEKRVNEAVAKYREYYQERGIFENVPYPGVEQMLKTLKDTRLNNLHHINSCCTSSEIKHRDLISRALAYGNLIHLAGIINSILHLPSHKLHNSR